MEKQCAQYAKGAKLWFAGTGKNRQLAAYELDELKEASEDAAKYQPEFKGKSIAKIIEPMTAEPVTQLEKAIEAKDSVCFVRAYDSLSHACTPVNGSGRSSALRSRAQDARWPPAPCRWQSRPPVHFRGQTTVGLQHALEQ
ncbi:hypothetical protein ACSEOQ_12850 [Pseudomonas aeruginosa]